MPPKEFALPFLTRDMLKFEQATKFSLVVQSAAIINTTIVITGATRSGPFTLKHSTVNTEVPQSETFNLPDIPIWISARSSVQDTQPNDVYVRISFALNDDIMNPLCGGYVYALKSISWPLSNIEPPIPESMGVNSTYSATNPGAGNEFSYSGKPYSISEIKSISFRLVTSATVANRRVHLSLFDGNTGDVDFHSSVDQTASQTRDYTCVPLPTAGSYANDNDIIIPISPNIVASGEYTIQSSTLNLQAGDAFTNVKITLVEKRSTLFF